MELPIEDLLESLPAEVLERPAELKTQSTSDESSTDDEGATSDMKKSSKKVSRSEQLTRLNFVLLDCDGC